MARYIPKGGNGGDRRSGKPNKMSELAERQAVLTGDLPHMLLAKWAQTGVMDQVKTKRIGSAKKGYRFVPEKNADGTYEREPVVLAPFERIDCAKSCAGFFASKRSPVPDQLPDHMNPMRIIEAAALRMRERLMLALPPPIEEDATETH